MDRPQELRVIPILFPQEVRPGDSLAEMIADAVMHRGLKLVQGDILIVKHKIVSKAEGQMVKLDSVHPSRSSRQWGKRFGVDPRVTELALSQSKRIVRRKHGVLITETRHGLVCANSGVDVSNVDGGEHALLLPENPDRSAERLRRAMRKRFKISVPIIITDSFGRPWREGLTEAAIGLAGMEALRDHRGERDPHGYRLRVSVEAVADELACAAGLVCGKLARTPVCLIRGFLFQRGGGKAKDLIRPAAKDLFR